MPHLVIFILQVNWRPVFWGLEIQFYFALAIIKWPIGNDIFQWCGDRVTEFLAHTDAGAGFVFGNDTFRNHFFAMAVSNLLIFGYAVLCFSKNISYRPVYLYNLSY